MIKSMKTREVDIFFFFFYPTDKDTDLSENNPENVPENKNAGYVFISYSSKNKDTAEAIRNVLHKNGIKSWMAPMDIPTGSNYAKVINKAIKNCSCLLLLLTKSAQESIWVPKEVERALNYKKTIIPVQLEDVVLNDEFEFYISTSQILPVHKIDESSPPIQDLLHIVRKHVQVSQAKK